MILERMLSKFTAFAQLSSAPSQGGTVKAEPHLEDDSDNTSVFSDDDEYSGDLIENSSTSNASQQPSVSSNAAGKKKRSRDSDDDELVTGGASMPSPSKKAKKASAPGHSNTVRFHPDTLDNWRWADRDMHAIRALTRSSTPFTDTAAPSSPSAAGPAPLPSLTPSATPGPLLPPPIATPCPVRLSESSLRAFLESDPLIAGQLGVGLPHEGGASERALDSMRAQKDADSREPSLCDEMDPPSRSPSPETRKKSWGGPWDGVWGDDEEEEEELAARLKAAPTPLSSPTLPSHPNPLSLPSSSAAQETQAGPDTSLSAPAPIRPLLSPSQLSTFQAHVSTLDTAAQEAVEQLMHHRCQEAWRSGFQVGIHTQLTTHALAAAVENKEKLLGDSNPCLLPDSKPLLSLPSSSADTSLPASKVAAALTELANTNDKKKRKRKEWGVITVTKEDFKKRAQDWAVQDAAKTAQIRARQEKRLPKRPKQEPPASPPPSEFVVYQTMSRPRGRIARHLLTPEAQALQDQQLLHLVEHP